MLAKTAKKAKGAKAARKTTAARKAPPKKQAAPPTPRTVTPYLAVNGAAEAIAWYKKVFGAKETSRQMAGPDKIMHAGLRIGDSDVYLSDIFPGSDVPDPSRVGATVTIHVYSKNINKFWQNAVANGAKVVLPIDNMFWGDRYGQFLDPFGHRWAVNYKVKMSKSEMDAKRAEAMKQMGGAP